MAYKANLLNLTSTLTSIVNSNTLHNMKDFYRLFWNFYMQRRVFTTVDLSHNFESKESIINIENVDVRDAKISFIYNKPRENITNFTKHKVNEYSVDVKRLTYQKINDLISIAVKEKNMKDIKDCITYCIDNSMVPSNNNLNKLFTIFSDIGDISMVKSLQKLLEKQPPNILRNYSNFNYYLGKAHCVKGNVDEAFLIFYKVFKDDRSMKIPIRVILRNFIHETITKSSEASIVVTQRHVKNFALVLNEWSPMMDFWQTCWLSEWYKDQQLADELFNDYEKLREHLSNRMPIISSFALKNNYESAVQNLLELLLKYDMRHQYTLVIGTLFDYKYKYDDEKGCAEIIKNCDSLRIKLSDIHYEKYLYMQITTDKAEYMTKEYNKKETSVDQFKFKF